MSNISAAVARKLLTIKAIQLSPERPFTWASGILSPIYCDNRKSLSYPEVRNFIRDELAKAAMSFGDFDVVAGVATAGIPHGALVADVLEKPFIYVRSKPKDHGMQNLIEGEIPNGKRVLVVEDLISTGGSSVQAINALKETGAIVIGTIAIFTYGFDKAIQTFSAADCPFVTLSNYDDLLNEAVEMNYISAEILTTLQAWKASPSTWKGI
jgi:orotate phosphoribosyltransferase